MKRPLERAGWLALPLCLALAMQLQSGLQVRAVQQAGEPHGAGGQQDHSSGSMASAPMSLGAESGSALEASAALAADDLIAAESSQSPDAAEHKAFTRQQEAAQQAAAASVAPVFAAPPQQPQQVQQVQQQQQQPKPQMFNVHHPQHLQALQARMAHPAQKFNPFMAAALAGNYGPAQQMAAAAAANLQAQRAHPQHQAHQQHQHQLGPAHPAHLLGVAHQGPRTVMAAGEPAALAVQESAVRNNVVPAPSFSSMLDSNSIELGDSAAQHQPHQVGSGSGASPSSGSGQPQQPSQQPAPMAMASSGQHPVIAAASNAMQSQAQPESGAANAWPLQAPDIPKIVNLEVKCEKNLMKVSIEFDKVFNGVIFSKGHYSQGQCLHVGQNSGKQQAYFDISINSCGTQGNTQNGLYGMGGNTGSGTYFENTIVIQYDPNVQEVYDHARKLRCTWHDQYEKAVTFRPFPVDMLDIVRADFAGDNVGCWMQIQVGKGPWASEVAGIVKIGQTMTMVLAIKDEENKFDMLVRNCFAHDGKRGPIELVDKSGCITRPKLMSRFTKIKNFGSSATVLSYAHFQAFKFPDSMEVHFQCTIQICRHQCPEQCSAAAPSAPAESYSESTISGTFNIHGAQQAPGSDSVHLRKYGQSAALSRERRSAELANATGSLGRPLFAVKPLTQTVGLNRVIQVVSAGDLAFAIQQQQQQAQQAANGSGQLGDFSQAEFQASRMDLTNQVCMSSYNFVLALVLLALVLLCSSLVAVSLYLRQRSLAKRSSKLLAPSLAPSTASPLSSCPSSPASTQMRPKQVPTSHQQQQQQQLYDQHLQHHHLVFDALNLRAGK